MMKKLKAFFSNFLQDKSQSRLVDNFLSLSVLQGANYFLPLLTVPYLVRIVGIEKFGLLMFAHSFIAYINIVTDYGFNLSATKEIALHRNNQNKISEIFSTVFTIKLFLLITCLIGLLIIVFSFERFYQNVEVYFLYYGMVIGNVLFPVWVFQGMEKMRYITYLNITSKVIFTILIFVFIDTPEDFFLAPIFQSSGYIIAGLISLFIIFKKLQLKYRFPSVVALKYYFMESTHYFISRVSVSLYTNTNTFMAGLVLGNSFAGVYSSAEKIFNALSSMYRPLNDALYPYMAKRKDFKLFKRIFWIALIVNAFVCISVAFGSDLLVELIYGEGFQVTSYLLKMFMVLAFLMIPATLIGYPLLGAFGFPQYANYSVVIASIMHIILLFVLIPVMNLYIIVGLLIFTQMVVLAIRGFGVKIKILKIKN